MNGKNIDKLNILLMLAACAAAYILPFELLLFSYAFLGPAHYLTQISWMHDRQYFTGMKWLWVPAAALALLLIVLWRAGGAVIPSQDSSFLLYALAIAASVGIVLVPTWRQRFAVMAGTAAGIIAVRWVFPGVALPLLLLMPTAVHVYIFTGAFILLGALRSRSLWGTLSFTVFVACGLVFLFAAPPPHMILPDFVANNIGIFDKAAEQMAALLSFGGPVDGIALTGFLSFAYTYHYLNWFSKAEIIKWNVIPRRRLAVIAAVYVASITLYLVDYRMGFAVLLFLSLIHVFLELPLNVITFRAIGALVKSRLAGTRSGQPAAALPSLSSLFAATVWQEPLAAGAS